MRKIAGDEKRGGIRRKIKGSGCIGGVNESYAAGGGVNLVVGWRRLAKMNRGSLTWKPSSKSRAVSEIPGYARSE